MATSDATLVIDAETAKSIRELTKLVQSQERVEKSTDKMSKAQKGASKDMDVMSTTAAAAGKAVVGLAASFASFEGIKELIAGINRELDETVKRADKTAKGMSAFATQIANDPNAAEILKATRVRGAGHGLDEQQTGQIANVVKAAGGNLTTDFDTAATLTKFGVSADDAAAIAQMGIARGAGSDVAASKALVATDLAPTDVATMARVAPRTRGYQSMEAGLAAAATLSTAGVTDEMLPSAVEAVGRALNKEESQLTKKLGLQGLSEAERLRKISEAADASGDRAGFLRQMPEKYGLGEEEGRGLQAILGQGDKYFESEAALRATGGGELAARHQRLRDIDPMMANAEDAQIAAQTAQIQDIYGPTAPFAQNKRARDQALGLKLQRDMPTASRLPGMVDEDTGEAGFFGKLLGALESTGSGGTGGRGVIADTNGQAQRQSQSTKSLEDALRENTEATRENSNATGAGTPQRNANL